MRDRYAVLLGNHGLLTGGKDIAYAFKVAEEVEFCAEVYYKTKAVGNPVILSEKDMEIALEKFKSYGHKK